MDIQLISSEIAKKIIDSGFDSGHYEPIGLYIVKDNDMWVGIDNSNGHCFVEESKSKEVILQWLNREIDTESLYELNNSEVINKGAGLVKRKNLIDESKHYVSIHEPDISLLTDEELQQRNEMWNKLFEFAFEEKKERRRNQKIGKHSSIN
ncbi:MULTISPECIES: hypothetical protein [Bacillati]|uniref:hypothetical protein n=1 Tax=Bacillati TaxID=1783272 RepID=UPI0022B9B577|nr:hypothetical protein [Caldifermentibacillus hisashii]